MNKICAIFFDVDGVLLNSLPQHFKICEDLALKYDQNITIPDEKTFKQHVREGLKISPMKYFFVAVGYDEEAAVKADKEYTEIFMDKYPPRLFDGVPEMLQKLSEAGLSLGVVTSNVTKNVTTSLGDCMKYFANKCFFTKDNSNGLEKHNALLEGCRILRIQPDQVLYIGDQIADKEAAEKAGINFLGVSYGWCFSTGETDISIVDNPKDIAIYSLSEVPPDFKSNA